MIGAIYADPKSQQIIRQTLEENGIAVEIGGSLLLKCGDLDCDRIVILKPDAYYNTVLFAMPPKSVDGVVLTGQDSAVRIYVAELRSSPLNRIVKSDIIEKFDTVFHRFFTEDFAHIFMRTPFDLESIELWLVCDPLGIRGKSNSGEEFIERAKTFSGRIRGMLADYAASFKPYSYKGHNAMIKVMVTPPIIEADGYVDALQGI